MMDPKIEGLVRLIDEALAVAHDRLTSAPAGKPEFSSIEALEKIKSGLEIRRNEAITTGYEVSDSYLTLGLARAGAELDAPDSELNWKIWEIEKYFLRHFVRNPRG